MVPTYLWVSTWSANLQLEFTPTFCLANHEITQYSPAFHSLAVAMFWEPALLSEGSSHSLILTPPDTKR